MSIRKIALSAVAGSIVLLLSISAAADTPLPNQTDTLHFKSPSRIVTDGGTDLRLPPGYFLPEPVWKTIDLEFRRLQEQETRLTAENQSMRKSLDEGPGWGTVALIAGTLLVGVTGTVLLK
jgi:hypothetical protein